jgi:hypothetical protein
VVDVTLRIVGLQRTRALLYRPPGNTLHGRHATTIPDLQRLAQLVQSAATRGPYRFARCLPQSLVTQRILAEYGVEGILKIGVQKNGASMQAHAWVEVDGVPLAQSPRLYEEFAVIGG